MTTKLLPCPFCGSQATSIGPYGGESLFGVQCSGCSAKIDGFDQCEEDARIAWNTRAPAAKSEAVAWEVTDEQWQRALDCAMSCLKKPFHISRSSMDNAMQHAFGMLSLVATPPTNPFSAREELARKFEELRANYKHNFLVKNIRAFYEFCFANSDAISAALSHGADTREAVIGMEMAVALARRLCQLFDSGGESQRSARARHASAIFQLLSVGLPDSREWQKCDADPVGYLEACERVVRSRSSTGSREVGQ